MSALKRYVEALRWVIDMKDPLRAKTLVVGSRTGNSSQTPPPQPGWAQDVINREYRWLRERAEWLENWMDDPHPIRGSGKHRRRCEGCGRGLSRGAKYCAQCGTEAPK